jgi:hypothetical protein
MKSRGTNEIESSIDPRAGLNEKVKRKILTLNKEGLYSIEIIRP